MIHPLIVLILIYELLTQVRMRLEEVNQLRKEQEAEERLRLEAQCQQQE